MANPNLSFTQQVRDLKEGETVARAKRIPFGEGVDAGGPARALAALRNSANQIAVRVRETGERNFCVESGSFLTHDGKAIIIVAAVTCTEDEGEDDI